MPVVVKKGRKRVNRAQSRRIDDDVVSFWLTPKAQEKIIEIEKQWG